MYFILKYNKMKFYDFKLKKISKHFLKISFDLVVLGCFLEGHGFLISMYYFIMVYNNHVFHSLYIYVCVCVGVQCVCVCVLV